MILGTVFSQIEKPLAIAVILGLLGTGGVFKYKQWRANKALENCLQEVTVGKQTILDMEIAITQQNSDIDDLAREAEQERVKANARLAAAQAERAQRYQNIRKQKIDAAEDVNLWFEQYYSSFY